MLYCKTVDIFLIIFFLQLNGFHLYGYSLNMKIHYYFHCCMWDHIQIQLKLWPLDFTVESQHCKHGKDV